MIAETIMIFAWNRNCMGPPLSSIAHVIRDLENIYAANITR